MRWRFAQLAELIESFDEAHAEMMTPDAIHQHARRQRMIRLNQPTGQGQSTATGLPVKWSESEGSAWKAAQDGPPRGGGAYRRGAPVDVNIREDFPHDQLVELIRRFAHGKVGSNEMTISCGDPETMAAAQRFPERYDLLRMRMGGWSEFFVAMFPHHQEQHLRRPIFEAEPE